LQALGSAAMAVTMIAAILLAIGGMKLASTKSTRSRGILMLVAAAVLVGNVVIWTA